MHSLFPRLLLFAVVFFIACVVGRSPDLGGSDDTNGDGGPSNAQPVGGQCVNDSDCAFILGNAHCLTQAQAASFGQGAPGGYCTSTTCMVNSPATSCGAGTICGNLISSGSGTDSFCEAACSTASQCRTGFDCVSGGCVLGLPIPDGGNVNPDSGMTGDNDSGMTNDNDSGMTGNNDAGMMGSNDAGMMVKPDAGMMGNNDAGMMGSNDAGMSCMTATTISGTVHAPTLPTLEAAAPIYGATVYVPTGTVAKFTPGATCEPCSAEPSGSPLVSQVTGPDGKFQLKVPPGTGLPLVVQIGRWRRQVLIPSVTACVDNPISDDLTRLPRTHAEGDIPLIAMVTGSGDPLECDLLKFGIDPGEFVDPGGTTGGRVEMYVNEGGPNGVLGGGSPGAALDSATPSMAVLMGSETTLMKYDLVLMGCPGVEVDQDAGVETNLLDYANAGGRIFASHYNFVWLDNSVSWESTAVWSPDLNTAGTSMTFSVDQTSTEGAAMASWLTDTGASTTPGEVLITDYRTDFTNVATLSTRLLYDSTQPLAYSFETPWNDPSAPACGRVIFGDMHSGITPTATLTFPGECPSPAAAMTPNEKALEFMLFNAGACVGP